MSVAGTLQVFGSGTINLSGGSLSVGTLANSGGQFNWSSGALAITGASGLTVDNSSAGLLGSTLNIGTGQALSVPNLNNSGPGIRLRWQHRQRDD